MPFLSSPMPVRTQVPRSASEIAYYCTDAVFTSSELGMGTGPHRRRGRSEVRANPFRAPRYASRSTPIGTLSNDKGEFQLPLGQQKLPLYLVVTYIGYDTARVLVQALKPLRIPLGEKEVIQQTVEIVDIRVSQKQQESPLTIETMDALAVRQSPSPDFYENLANLKGVDITTASLGFKIINTRLQLHPARANPSDRGWDG